MISPASKKLLYQNILGLVSQEDVLMILSILPGHISSTANLMKENPKTQFILWICYTLFIAYQEAEVINDPLDNNIGKP